MCPKLTVIASDSEAIQTRPQLETSSLDRFALLAMTNADRSSASGGTEDAPFRKMSHRRSRRFSGDL